jgi:hypothetical protein
LSWKAMLPKTNCELLTIRGSSRPLGYQSRDMGLFKGLSSYSTLLFIYPINCSLDTDGSGYLLTEDVSFPKFLDDKLILTGMESAPTDYVSTNCLVITSRLSQTHISGQATMKHLLYTSRVQLILCSHLT